MRTCTRIGTFELLAHWTPRPETRAAALANAHGGSKSIDGCGHAAYAAVYAQGGYAAVADRDAFAVEHAWQVAALQALVVEHAAQHAAHVES